MATSKLASTKKSFKKCSVDNCENKHFGKSYCLAHYNSIARKARLKAKGVCSVEGCFTHQTCKGFCAKHYQRANKYGDPHFVKAIFGEGETFEQKFWSKVAVTANPEKCWEWQAGKSTDGYGLIWFEGRSRNAHIISFYLANGYFSKILVLHSCDNPPCVNPAHLREGTDQDNANDKVSRNRVAKGSRHGHAILNEEQVKAIRKLYGRFFTQKQLGERFGVSRSTIRSILLNQTWRHVT